MNTRKNAMYNIAYRVFSVFLPLATAPYLSRTVGTAGVGLYSDAWSISYIFVLIGMLGLNDYGVRAISRIQDDRKELDRVFSEIWQMQLAVAGATLLLWFGYIIFAAGEEKTISLSLTMMSVSCFVNFDWCLMGMNEFKPVAVRNTIVKVLATVSVFFFVHSAEDLWVYGLVWSLSTLLGCLSCAMTLRGRVSYHPVPWKDAARHLGPCSVLFISVMAVNIYRTMDKVMVTSISGPSENGLYEDAEKIIYCLSGFISAIGTVMMPKISKMQKEGRTAEILKHIDRSMDLVICMVSAMAFGVAAVAEEFAPLFYGEDFIRSGSLMIPLAFTLIMIGFANVIRTQWVLPQSRDTIFVKSVCSGAAVNLVANALLIPSMGAMGAVIGTLAAELTVPVVQFVILRKELPYRKYLGYVLTYAVIGGIMLIAVRLAKTYIPVGGWTGLGIRTLTGIVVYGGGCVLWWKTGGNDNLSLLLRKERKNRS